MNLSKGKHQRKIFEQIIEKKNNYTSNLLVKQYNMVSKVLWNLFWNPFHRKILCLNFKEKLVVFRLDASFKHQKFIIKG